MWLIENELVRFAALARDRKFSDQGEITALAIRFLPDLRSIGPDRGILRGGVLIGNWRASKKGLEEFAQALYQALEGEADQS